MLTNLARYDDLYNKRTVEDIREQTLEICQAFGKVLSIEVPIPPPPKTQEEIDREVESGL